MSIQLNTVVECKITGISNFGAFVSIEGGYKGMIHISEISSTYLDDITKVYKVGHVVDAMVLAIADDGKVSLSIKRVNDKDTKKANKKEKTPSTPVTSPGDFQWESTNKEDTSFEDMMKKFKRTSEEKMSDLNKGESRGYSRKKGRR